MSKSNSTLFTNLLRMAKDKASYETGPIYLLSANYDEIGELVKQLAKRGEQSVRSCCLEFWSERSPDGKAYEAVRQKLADTEKRTPEQEATFQRMSKENNAMNIALERAVKAYRGVSFLRSIGIHVDIEKSDDGNSYDTYCQRPKVERNSVFFNASQLQKIEEHIPHIAKDAKAVDIRAMLKTAKKGAANVNKAKGNGEAIAPSKLVEPVANLDSTLAGLAKDGGGFAIGPEANKALLLLWARLDAQLTDMHKQQARDMFAAEGVASKDAAKPKAVVPNVVQAVKKQVAAK